MRLRKFYVSFTTSFDFTKTCFKRDLTLTVIKIQQKIGHQGLVQNGV